jgi:hypothetical protein
LGPVLFFAFNYWLARRRPERNALAFAVATIVLYILIDFGSTLAFGVAATEFLTLTVAASMAGKLAGALGGAVLGARRKEIAA